MAPVKIPTFGADTFYVSAPLEFYPFN